MSKNLIFSTLIHGKPLISTLPEAPVFLREHLAIPSQDIMDSLPLDQKLGHLYEDAFEVILKTSERYETLEKGLQIQSNKHHTLGEIDYLFRDLLSGQLIHLELAIKFYLSIDTKQKILLPGPDARDNYYKKLEHLRNHQLKLTRNYRKHLPEAYQGESIIVKQLTIGRIFDHITSNVYAFPEFLNPSASRGQWLHQKEFSNQFPDNPKIQIIPKYLWPAPISQLPQALLPLNIQDPLMRCTMVKIEGKDQPYFIAPDNYPEQGL